MLGPPVVLGLQGSVQRSLLASQNPQITPSLDHQLETDGHWLRPSARWKLGPYPGRPCHPPVYRVSDLVDAQVLDRHDLRPGGDPASPAPAISI
jgi:hypothetical protein